MSRSRSIAAVMVVGLVLIATADARAQPCMGARFTCDLPLETVSSAVSQSIIPAVVGCTTIVGLGLSVAYFHPELAMLGAALAPRRKRHLGLA